MSAPSRQGQSSDGKELHPLDRNSVTVNTVLCSIGWSQFLLYTCSTERSRTPPSPWWSPHHSPCSTPYHVALPAHTSPSGFWCSRKETRCMKGSIWVQADEGRQKPASKHRFQWGGAWRLTICFHSLCRLSQRASWTSRESQKHYLIIMTKAESSSSSVYCFLSGSHLQAQDTGYPWEYPSHRRSLIS